MRPIASEQNFLRYPLNEVLGTEGQVRLLRALATSATEPLTVTAAAANSHLTEMGARKALQRLVETGFVERLGRGRTAMYSLKADNQLIQTISNLFEVEERRFYDFLRDIHRSLAQLPEPPDSAWIMHLPRSSSEPLEIGVLCGAKVLTKIKDQLQTQLSELEQELDITFEIHFYTRADLPSDIHLEVHLFGVPVSYASIPFESRLSHSDLDRRSLTWARHLVELIKQDPSLIKRAQKHLNRVLQSDPGTATGDLEEWRRILETYSKRRINQLLVSSSPRAERLRQSSPFLAVLNDNERQYLLDSEERP